MGRHVHFEYYVLVLLVKAVKNFRQQPNYPWVGLIFPHDFHG